MDVDVQQQDGQAVARGTAKKSSHPWHFRCWSLRRNELECTDLVHWTEALHRFSSRDAIIVVGSVLQKHLDSDFTPDQEKEITFKTLATGVPKLKTWLGTQRVKTDMKLWASELRLNSNVRVESKFRCPQWSLRQSWRVLPVKHTPKATTRVDHESIEMWSYIICDKDMINLYVVDWELFGKIYVAPYSRPVPYSRHPPYSRHFFNETHENDPVWALFPIAVSEDPFSTQVCKGNTPRYYLFWRSSLAVSCPFSPDVSFFHWTFFFLKSRVNSR